MSLERMKSNYYSRTLFYSFMVKWRMNCLWPLLSLILLGMILSTNCYCCKEYCNTSDQNNNPYIWIYIDYWSGKTVCKNWINNRTGKIYIRQYWVSNRTSIMNNKWKDSIVQLLIALQISLWFSPAQTWRLFVFQNSTNFAAPSRPASTSIVVQYWTF